MRSLPESWAATAAFVRFPLHPDRHPAANQRDLTPGRRALSKSPVMQFCAFGCATGLRASSGSTGPSNATPILPCACHATHPWTIPTPLRSMVMASPRAQRRSQSAIIPPLERLRTRSGKQSAGSANQADACRNRLSRGARSARPEAAASPSSSPGAPVWFTVDPGIYMVTSRITVRAGRPKH